MGGKEKSRQQKHPLKLCWVSHSAHTSVQVITEKGNVRKKEGKKEELGKETRPVHPQKLAPGLCTGSPSTSGQRPPDRVPGANKPQVGQQGKKEKGTSKKKNYIIESPTHQSIWAQRGSQATCNHDPK